MQTLIYAPDQAGYSVEDSSDRIKSNVGHVSNYRRNLPNGNRPIDASWQCSKEIYTYLARAYRAFIASGGNPFLCDMIMDNANVAESFKTRFVAGSFGLTSVQGETYYVRAKLNVTPNKYNVDTLPYVFDASTRKVNFQVESGSYILTGNPVIFKLSVIHMNAATGAYSLVGNSAILRAPDKTIQIGTGSYTVAGQNIDADLVPNTGSINANGGAYTLTGNPATLTKNDAPLTNSIMVKGAAWSGGGISLSAGTADIVYVEVQSTGIITSVIMLGGGGPGSATVDVWKTAYVGALPTSANKINGSTPASITSDSKSQDTTLSGWTTSVTAGDVFAFKLLTSNTFTWLNVTLEITQ